MSRSVFFLMILLVLLPGRMAAEVPGELLKALGSEKFEQREDAYGKLRAWAKKNLKSSPEELFKVWQPSEQPEVRSRCFVLMKEVAIQRKFGKGRGFIGIQMQESVYMNGQGKPRVGVLISTVQAGRPGERAGLKINDIITGVDQLDFSDVDPGAGEVQGGFQWQEQRVFGVMTRFGNYIQSKQPDDVITLHLLRGKEKLAIKVTLMKRPPEADMGVWGRQGIDREAEKREFFDRWLKTMQKK